MTDRWKVAGKCECGAKLMKRRDGLDGYEWWDAPFGAISHPHQVIEAAS